MNQRSLQIIFSALLGLMIITISYAQMDNSTDSTMEPMMDQPETNVTQPANETIAEDIGEEEETAEETEPVVQAIAIVEGTTEGSELYGEVEFVETKEGLNVTAEVYNAPQGKHGIHIHENGSCADSGNAAGGHFNPDAVKHGMVAKDGLQGAHVGDFGNIEVDEYGDGFLTAFIPGASLTQGKYNVVGKAIVLHEKEDDFSQPTGNAGGRIGCGVIEKTAE